jgi:hypothetical protein
VALSLTQKIVRLHEALERAAVPHAFGGALALAYCTEEPRGTNDIDVNLFVGVDQAPAVLRALPRAIGYDDADLQRIQRDGQARLWWDTSPVDVFFDNHAFHERARRRSRVVPFAGIDIPVLDCTDLAVFKTFFARSKDFVDIETMAAANAIDAEDVLATIDELLGPSHPSRQALTRALGVADQ